MGTRTENLDLIIRARQTAAAKANLDAVASSLAGIGAAALGFVSVKSLFTGVISSTVTLHDQMIDLRAAVERAGLSWQDNSHQIGEFTKRMTTQKGVIDDLTRTSLPLALDYTKNLADAETIVSAAADLAAAKHIDLETAVNLLGKAYLGHTETLVRYGIEIEDKTKALKDADYIQSQVDARFAGASAASTEKLTTKWVLLKEAIEATGEALGKRLGVDKSGGFIEGMAGFFDLITNFVEKPGPSFAIMLDQIGYQATRSDRALIALAHDISGPLSDAEIEAILHGARLGKELHTVETAAEAAARGIKEVTKAAQSFGEIKLFEDPNFIKIEDWWAATESLKTMSQEMYDSWKAAYDGVESEAEATAARAAEMWGEGGEVVLSSVTAAEEMGSAWSRSFNAVANSAKRTMSTTDILAKALWDGLSAAWDAGVRGILESWKWLNEETNGILKKMAQDFVRYFIESILDSMKYKLIPGIIGFLGSLFDTPANDRMAQRQGRDFADHFTRGIMSRLTPSFVEIFGNAMPHTFGMFNSLPQRLPSNYVGAFGGPPITINVTGNVMTPEFVQNHLGPLIEKYSRGGSINIQYENNFKTGAPVLAF